MLSKGRAIWKRAANLNVLIARSKVKGARSSDDYLYHVQQKIHAAPVLVQIALQSRF